MKILHTVEYYYPSTGGVQEVVKQISERLVRLGHRVTVATTKLPERKNKIINGVNLVEFDVHGKTVEGLGGEVENYRNFLLKSDFDVITNFAAQQWATDIMLPVLDEIKAKKVFVPTGFSSIFQPKYKNYFEQMKIWMKKYDMNIFLSNDYRDINFARKNKIKNVVVIPNGAGEDEFLSEYNINIRKQLNIPLDNFLILHVGSHTNLKGHKEAIDIFSKAKIKDSTLLIVGNDYPHGCQDKCKLNARLINISPRALLNNKKIIISSLPRKETVSAYQTADLFLFPSNIECSPLVLFECMASKIPFLTTDVGNSKEIIKWSGSGLLLPTVIDKDGYSHAKMEESSQLLEDIYHNPSKQQILKEAGFKAWKNSFTWEKITKEYESMYKTLLKKLICAV